MFAIALTPDVIQILIYGGLVAGGYVLRHVNVLRLFTFGGLGLEPDDGSTAPRLRPPRLALLAAIAAAGDRGVSRERLVGIFWP